MANLVRFGLSMESRLLARLDGMIKKRGYTNRSEFIRDLIRERLVEGEWETGRKVVGTVTIVYNPHVRLLSERLVDLQHRHHRLILATTHVHIDEEMCVEMILVKGRAGEIGKIADLLRREKGVLHASLSMSSTGKDLI